ncbi:glycosyl hydrolase family 18 [Colletotrichum graminicola]|uniref:chitinase n=1 Tax=Colletotrichum graminicola (strain M1.001 / M2 / FGSC 10212) TaxID=645133 RepID=E3R101_COLGM|nr:glycosyl hydrolase family 18 [Colletotrichum graminicola M1.001]EFQ36789.1 glycosyl hydrolase family 18 [Colletotrichum graminicola M1.001]WDK10049.1 glycosyl hydrolase family 18 [Colletotrichum graminicola]
MKTSSLCALVAVAARAFASSDLDARQTEDELDQWLSAVQAQPLDALKSCPVSCSTAGDDPWFLFPDASHLASCNETMLLSIAVQAAEENENNDRPTVVRACTADYDTSTSMRLAFVPDSTKASLCLTANKVLSPGSIHMHQPSEGSEFLVGHLMSAGQQVKSHLASQVPSCTSNVMAFGYSQSAVIGLFAGAEVHQHGVTADVLDKFLEHAQDKSISSSTMVQLCGAEHRGADYSIGIVASSTNNLDFVQQAVKTWADGKYELQFSNNSTGNGTASSHQFTPRDMDVSPSISRLLPRADCRFTTVQANEGCYAVAERCGISQTQLQNLNRANLCDSLVREERVCCSSGTLPSTLPPGNSDGTCKTRQVIPRDDCGSLANKYDFMKANSKTGLCSSLAEGQHVCCSQGKLPDLRPKEDADGYCAVYTTKEDDYCSKIAASFMLTIEELESFNKNTWGWNGCKTPLYTKFNVCVSEGAAPMPAIVPNAVCGPTMNGTIRPPAGTNISELNPCPLNVCCNIWGQCGMADDFCIVSKSETGAPGTSAPGKNGCISNCGRDIIKGSAPAKKVKLGYFEGWNLNRKCLTMDASQINTDAYTHVHFAFPNVTRGDFRIEITDPQVKEQFDYFKKLEGVKKIVSLGGWDFSALPGTFMILREAAQPANRDVFKRNIISFINEHNLDGIDLDWEYPGAPDIPDIPSDDPVNGVNYYRLLVSIKAEVGSSKSVSFAAPASYWYLRALPIKQMAAALDYIVFMTYDLHGQWDAGNKWTSPGCPTGNCLRSHVNETETKDALSMITKAGAASNKILFGVSSYGRSFKMAQAGCDGETCLFTGDNRHSGAAKGRCTGTAGYISNAEIDEIKATDRSNKVWTKEGSNIMAHDNTEWVAWMDDDMKAKRAEFYDSYNFLGTTDWAIDLQEWLDGSGSISDDNTNEFVYKELSACTASFSTLKQLEERKGSIPSHCLEQYIVDVQVAVFDDSLKKYNKLIEDGYDSKFSTWKGYIKEQIPGQIKKSMATDKVDKYFKCGETKTVTCCNTCKSAWCGVDCERFEGCKNGKQMVPRDKCPKAEFDPTGLGGDHPNSTFTLTDREGFFKDIHETWGVDEEWITFSKRQMSRANGCQYAGKDVKDCIAWNSIFFHDFPTMDSGKTKINNPKDIIVKALPDAKGLLDRYRDMKTFAEFEDDLEMSDLTDSGSLPAFAVEQAVGEMEKIVKEASGIEKKRREEFILSMIMGFLFFIPFLGPTGGSAVAVGVRTLLRLIEVGAEVGLAVYSVVNDPDNAFMTVFTTLLAAGFSRGGFRDAARSRRGMSSNEYNSLGNIKLKLDIINTLWGSMCSL